MMRISRGLLSACVGLAMLSGAPLFAQPAHPAQPAKPSASGPELTALTDKARELYLEGQEAGAKKRWGEAYANFLAAWSLKPHYQIAGNLGWVEVELGRYREAAEHLSYYLREAPKEKVKERQSVEVLLAEARKHVGALALQVEPAGAEVLLDGVSIGKAPLAGEVFVEPGPRAIEARLDGYKSAKEIVEMAAGSSREVPLRLMKSESEAPSVAGVTGAATKSERPSVTKAQGSERDEGRPYRGVVIAGIAASVAAVGMGVGFAIVASGKADNADERLAVLVGKGGARSCSAPAFAPDCIAIDSDRQARDTFRDLAIWSFIGGGVLSTATVIYAVAAPRSKPPGAARVLPQAFAGGGGLLLVGEW